MANIVCTRLADLIPWGLPRGGSPTPYSHINDNVYLSLISATFLKSIEEERSDVLEFLLDNVFILQPRDGYLHPLEFAAKLGKMKAFELLLGSFDFTPYNKLKATSADSDLFIPSVTKITPLLYSAIDFKVQVAELLLKNGYKVLNEYRIENNKSVSVLQQVIDSRNFDCLKSLLDFGINTYETYLYERNMKPYFPFINFALAEAVSAECLDAVKLLVEYGSPLKGTFAFPKHDPRFVSIIIELKNCTILGLKDCTILDFILETKRVPYLDVNACNAIFLYLFSLGENESTIYKSLVFQDAPNIRLVLNLFQQIDKGESLQKLDLSSLELDELIKNTIANRLTNSLIKHGIKAGDFDSLLRNISNLNNEELKVMMYEELQPHLDTLVSREAEILYAFKLVDSPIALIDYIQRGQGLKKTREIFDQYNKVYNSEEYKYLVNQYFHRPSEEKQEKLVQFLKQNAGKALSSYEEVDYCKLFILDKANESTINSLVINSEVLTLIRNAMDATKKMSVIHKAMQELIYLQTEELKQKEHEIELLKTMNDAHEQKFAQIFKYIGMQADLDTAELTVENIGVNSNIQELQD